MGVADGAPCSCSCEWAADHRADPGESAPSGAVAAVAPPERAADAARAPRERVYEKQTVTHIELAWGDPPPRMRRASPLDKIRVLVPDLKERPGKWARLCIYSSKTGAGGARKRLAVEFGDDFEFQTRIVEPVPGGGNRQPTAVWGRYRST